MDVTEAIKRRRSVRRYTGDPVTEDDVRAVLTAAIWAPSAGNAQPWRFIVVRDRALREGLVEAAHGQRFLAEAPVVIVVCADLARARRAYGERGATLYCLQDTAAAIQNMLLAATSQGLGSCWVGAFDEGKASELLKLPTGLRPVALIPLGRFKEPSPPQERRPLSEVVEYR
ncbi:nitroreductase family protein [Candidatus Bipolaricaulota bacterium]|nr:nitroreductase family protein [Candidatus Bipolaricaulota bacterium]